MRRFGAIAWLASSLFVALLPQHKCHVKTGEGEIVNVAFEIPQIDFANQSVGLAFEDRWNVSCKSNKLISWIWYYPWYEWNTNYVSSAEYFTDQTDKMYQGNQTIIGASAWEVGRYYCIHKNSSYNLKDHMDKMNRKGHSYPSVYVYVRNTMRTVVPLPNEPLMIDQYDHFIIPCKPSYPDVKVKLCNTDNKQCFASYDPQIGFPFHAGSFNSTAILNLSCSSNSYRTEITVKFKPALDKNEPRVKFDYQVYVVAPMLTILLLMCLLISVLYSKKTKEVRALRAKDLAAMLEGELMVIVEYCPFGNLLNILRTNRSRFIDELNEQIPGAIIVQSWTSQDTPMSGSSSTEPSATVCERSISTTDLICWAFQIANGMDYLASRKVLHGDLAARNVLLSNDNVVKIGDFGLARSLYNEGKYKKKTKSPLPVRWLALECFTDALFSTYSDVWAYGILLWELFSLGMVPYPGVEVNSEFYKMLRDGYRMEMPSLSNEDIYDIMLSCWKVRPDSRPSFKELTNHFNAMLTPETQDYYLALNEPYLAEDAGYMDPQDTEYLPSLESPKNVAPEAPGFETPTADCLEMINHTSENC